MSNIVKELYDKGLISPPKWLLSNTVYLTITGSIAYGAEDTTQKSDFDIYGVCIPPKNSIFPHLDGKIYGFDDIDVFQQYQQHHIFDESALAGKGREYDFNIYSIVKFFKLLMENNPSCIDTLFTSQECVLHLTQVGQLIRDNRKLFLHKGCWHKYKGYAYSMLHKMDSKNPEEDSKRHKLREQFGFDVKYAMHVVRLLLEAEQILLEGDLDLRRHKEQLKSIRRGEWTVERIKKWANDKEVDLEKVYATSDAIPYSPDKEAIKRLLLECLSVHYGSLKDVVEIPDQHLAILKNIKEQIEKAGI